jgi:antitoxin YefM
VSEAQSDLPRLLREARKGEAIVIRRHNETVAYVLSPERMEAIIETLEILANDDAMRAIRAHQRGKLRFRSLRALDE